MEFQLSYGLQRSSPEE